VADFGEERGEFAVALSALAVFDGAADVLHELVQEPAVTAAQCRRAHTTAAQTTIEKSSTAKQPMVLRGSSTGHRSSSWSTASAAV
jgi:hypothetical protein